MSIERLTITVRSAKDGRILYRDMTEASPGMTVTGGKLDFDVGFFGGKYVIEVDTREREDE